MPVAGATVILECPLRGGTSITTDKKGNWTYLGLAACEWKLDIKAEGFVTKSLKVSMGSEPARMSPVEVKLEKPKGPPPELVEAIRKGDAAFGAQQWAEARVAYEKVAEPWMRASTKKLSHSWPRSMMPASRTKALAKDPKIVEAYYWRGTSYVQQQKLAEAKADMQRVLELEPSGPNADKAAKTLEQLK
jgi:tetratricopeptide (TPR) repeat protein